MPLRTVPTNQLLSKACSACAPESFAATTPNSQALSSGGKLRATSSGGVDAIPGGPLGLNLGIGLASADWRNAIKCECHPEPTLSFRSDIVVAASESGHWAFKQSGTKAEYRLLRLCPPQRLTAGSARLQHVKGGGLLFPPFHSSQQRRGSMPSGRAAAGAIPKCRRPGSSLNPASVRTHGSPTSRG